MSTFEVKIYKMTIEPHPNADAIELAKIGEYRSVVRKGQYQTGDLGAYIPEGAIVPDWAIEKLDLTGKLAGPKKNRVKAMKLRGVVSQGLIYPVEAHVPEKAISDALLWYGTYDDGTREGFHHVVVHKGMDVSKFLGITKYEPPIPVHMAGEVWNAFGYTLNYDIENVKRYPDLFKDGEEVVMTEKLHGTWTCFGWHPDVGPIITSKGLSARGLAFKINDANNGNLYLRMLEATRDTLGKTAIDRGIYWQVSFYILGETFGAGVQDLQYGMSKPTFRVFDIYIGNPGSGRYLDYQELKDAVIGLGLQLVPNVYEGPFSMAKLLEVTSGKELVSSKSANIREGVVVKPIHERQVSAIGRLQLKSVSDAYLLRGGEITEFN